MEQLIHQVMNNLLKIVDYYREIYKIVEKNKNFVYIYIVLVKYSLIKKKKANYLKE